MPSEPWLATCSTTTDIIDWSAADNRAAIACYTKVELRPVGIRRLSERGTDGSWHDALLMDLLAGELVG
jgi:RimJ/RimL family protein N-acetyltransferase